MSLLYEVRVREDYPWGTARVGGRMFAKAEATPVPESEMTDEIRNSPLLVVSDALPTDPARTERAMSTDMPPPPAPPDEPPAEVPNDEPPDEPPDEPSDVPSEPGTLEEKLHALAAPPKRKSHRGGK